MDPPKSANDDSNEASPKPVRSHGGSTTTSPVWEYFKLNADNPIQATCLMCGILMSRGGVSPSRCGTTNLRRHLSFAHGIDLPSKKKPQQAVQPLSQQPDTSSKPSSTQKAKQKKTVVPVPTEPYLPDELPPYEVCLRWKSYHTNMQTILPILLSNEHFVDVTLACEGRSIKCHRVILSACSSYFEEILCHTPCQHPIVLIKDLQFQELRTLVDFMYRGEVYVAQERLPSLLAAAETLQIKGLSSSPSVTSLPCDDTIPATSVRDETDCSKLPVVSNTTGKQKFASTVREKYKPTIPGTSKPIGVDKSSGKGRPNGVQKNINNADKSHKLKRKSPLNPPQFKFESQEDNIRKNSFPSGLSQTVNIKSESVVGSLDLRLKGPNHTTVKSEPEDVILSNDSICPAPVCELSDQESMEKTSDGEDKTWSRECEEMVPTDDYSETDEMDGSQVCLMVPEVVMDSDG